MLAVTYSETDTDNLMILVYIMLESYIFRQISAKLLPKIKSSTIVET